MYAYTVTSLDYLWLLALAGVLLALELCCRSSATDSRRLANMGLLVGQRRLAAEPAASRDASLELSASRFIVDWLLSFSFSMLLMARRSYV